MWEHRCRDKEGQYQLEGTDRRVVFPITDADGECITLHGRAIDAQHFGSPKISKGDKSLGVFQTAGALESEIVAIVGHAQMELELPVNG